MIKTLIPFSFSSYLWKLNSFVCETSRKSDIEMEADLPKLGRKDHAHQRAWGEDRTKPQSV